MKKLIIFLTVILLLMSGITAYAYWTDKLDLKLEAPMYYAVPVQIVGNGNGGKAPIKPPTSENKETIGEITQPAEPTEPDLPEELQEMNAGELQNNTESKPPVESTPEIAEEEVEDDGPDAE
ncbi:MAG: hypothetical protein Q4D65_08350 [Peptostreptococcaceae bacterium]|nr:hypothetical protein [Peptostreptococcaceae bacterium]